MTPLANGRKQADGGGFQIGARAPWRIMAGGPTAQAEVELMIGEKVEAGSELIGTLAGGRVKSPQAAARKTLSIYGKRVRNNRKRLAAWRR